MRRFSAWAVFALLSLLTLKVRCEDGFDLADALGDDDDEPAAPTVKPPSVPAGGDELDLSDAMDFGTPTKKPVPPAPAPTKAAVKPKPKPGPDDFDLGDALDPNNDIGGKGKGGKGGGSFTDDDLTDLGDYKPEKGSGKGGHGGGAGTTDLDNDDYDGTMAETGTIAGIVSAVAMALVGAVTSYISYQKKKFCFSIQQSLNTDMVKAENPDAVVAQEPQVQQTLLQPPNAEPPAEENAV
ncbi:CD99 antigen-like protein 2 isoform X4 [Alosa sapidissima]|uniref:CD99 antigen-like protein 2 isoform X4 n=1 Tax=Alosa sapidissima TaxID=34773 RepID=UPI001C096E74|nr:CD99 antigen-like protein 2 isoform X4 [Alosa sapidissima]